MYEEERQQGIEMQGFGHLLTGPRMAGRGGSLVPGTEWKLLLLMSMHRCQADLLGYGAWSFLVTAALDNFAQREEGPFIYTLATDPTRGATSSIPYQFATDRALSHLSNSEARYDQPSNASLRRPSSRRWLAEALMLVVIPGRQNGTRWGMVSVANILLGYT